MTLWNLLLFGLWIFFTSNPALILDSQLPLEYIRCLFLVFFRYLQVLFHFLWQLLLKPGIRLSLFVYWILSLMFFQRFFFTTVTVYFYSLFIFFIHIYFIFNCSSEKKPLLESNYHNLYFTSLNNTISQNVTHICKHLGK